MSERAISRMTEAEFLEWQRHQDRRYELVDGMPRAMTGARFRHDRVVINTMSTLLDGFEQIDSPCRPFTADIAVRVPTGNLRRPDVAVYCPPFDEDAMVSDRPRLVVEVLSESTEDTDQYVKVDEYQHMPELDYILLIAPRIVDVLAWARGDDRSWHSKRYQSLEDDVPLPRLGVTLSLARVYRSVELRPRPRLVAEG
ncbi:MAG TPA: Uma2 family endonuclease [Acetobacteraceae bacterium]|nr:Uma2 family endonuclease [Acetobacteraceae bacterium]